MVSWWDVAVVVAPLDATAASLFLTESRDTSIIVVDAPAPVAGAGLPFLLVVGGYVLARRYRRHRKIG